MAMDPTVIIHGDGFVQHVDHRQAGLAAIDAVYPAARNAMAFPRPGDRRGSRAVERPAVVYLFFTDKPTAWVDVTDTMEIKLAALREHVSQLRKPDELEEMLRGWAARGWPAHRQRGR